MFDGLEITIKKVKKDHYILVIIKGDQKFSEVLEKSQIRYLIGKLDNEI
ncbi:MAG: hypothetical protein Unbinned96contig1002_29 [Prokaryotic dsDNA virus sp.]|nr:MAG: hypothetical protein Unbinned96contig1002_29 [Prokaryotic dsDNA virus sp.]|tara:strand:- start:8140 stop:8286 length:147 start_codon:yes stop_codon:yes gene_type:complete